LSPRARPEIHAEPRAHAARRGAGRERRRPSERGRPQVAGRRAEVDVVVYVERLGEQLGLIPTSPNELRLAARPRSFCARNEKASNRTRHPTASASRASIVSSSAVQARSRSSRREASCRDRDRTPANRFWPTTSSPRPDKGRLRTDQRCIRPCGRPAWPADPRRRFRSCLKS